MDLTEPITLEYYEEINGAFNTSGNLSSFNDTFDPDTPIMYMSSLGFLIAIPEWEAALTLITLSLIIIFTVIGNILVIISVFTHRPLRQAPNFFIVSLAVADLTVAFLVLPINVAYSILGRWVFGKLVCEFWLTCDVLCCTSSILHLVAIAVDRYRAITDPVNYAGKRTFHRVLFTIGVVWVVSFLISSPPIFGWNDWPHQFNENTPCELTKQQGYVIYSALGSFFMPLVVMTVIYLKIYIATRRRLRQRARASRLSAIARQKSVEGGRSKRSRMICGGGSGGGDGDGIERDRSSVSSLENNGHDGGSGDHITKPTGDSINRRSGQGSGKIKRSSTKDSGGGNRSKVVNGGDGNGNRSSSNTAASSTASKGILKGRLHSQLIVDECCVDNSKLSPAHISEDSVTDAEAPLNRDSQREASASRNHHRHGSSHSGGAGGGKRSSGHLPSQQFTQFVEEKQRISLSKERKAARTLGVIMGVFFICWVPFFLMYIILPFCGDYCVQPSAKLANFITWLGYVNSGLNPLIYTIFNLDFRRAFKKILHLDK